MFFILPDSWQPAVSRVNIFRMVNEDKKLSASDTNQADMNEKSSVANTEEEVLKFWRDNKIFEKTLEKEAPNGKFVFYDGPPFATGPAHYGHILAGTIKDAIPRYQTMKGKFVRRNWGWDCHGLPVENLIEQELGLEHKKDIEIYGIDKFNQKARESVLRYDSQWKELIPRTGRFIDMENSYKTMDWQYTESIWWAFKSLHDKKLIYEGYKSMHICPRCETTLANSEVTLNYKDITDISLTAKFELEDELGTFVLAWTTTPWTLPGNVALAVGEKIDYVKVKVTAEDGSSENYILAKERLPDVLKDKQYEILIEVNGGDLVGKRYKPVFDYYYKDSTFSNHDNGWKIYGADFVTTNTGTGVVHIAPAFGEDDMELGKIHNLPFVQHVGMDGKFRPEVADFAGAYVKQKGDNQSADIEVIKNLAGKGLLFSKEKIVHSYPHCWRCDTPLLNYAAGSWFVKVADIKEKLLSENEKINWVPETIKNGRFGNWLEGARDWAISRSRFWGAPIPVWKCEDCGLPEVVGSLEQMKRLTSRGNKYYVVRHGESDSNAGNFASTNPNDENHLTQKGRDQVKEAGLLLKNKNIDIVFSSDLARCRETASDIVDEISFDRNNMIEDKRLREVNVGDFNGQPNAEYHGYFSSLEEKFYKNAPNGENLQELKNRVMDFLYEVDSKYEGKNILIVTSEYPAWMFVAGTAGLDVKGSVKIKEVKDEFLKNAELMELQFSPIPHNENYELDMHRPYIDKISFNCRCGGETKRVQEVFDCWFESGSMPYAQFHYPFENETEFKNNFPADFIAEGLDQTRGWFYNTHVLSTGLFETKAYNNVVVNGLILAEDGQKMSKKLKNYPDPAYILNKFGADSLRYYLLSSPVVRGEDLNFTEKGVDEVFKKIILRLNNVYTFYETYKGNTGEVGNIESDNVLDLWITARLRELISEIETNLDKYEIDKATKPIMNFVDDLSTWYLRRSRERFKADNETDKKNAIETTRYVIQELSKTIAPFMPFVAESLYRKVKGLGGKESVHLESWPKISVLSEEEKKLINDMNTVREIVSLGLLERAKAGIKVRQPLHEIRIKNEELGIKNDSGTIELIKDELNVKEVIFDTSIAVSVQLDTVITPELKTEGDLRDLMRNIQDLRKKNDLTPSDFVKLRVFANENGRKLFTDFEDTIKKNALISSIEFTDGIEGEKFEIGESLFTIELVR